LALVLAIVCGNNKQRRGRGLSAVPGRFLFLFVFSAVWVRCVPLILIPRLFTAEGCNDLALNSAFGEDFEDHFFVLLLILKHVYLNVD
jgi:hypothetical protein